MAPGVMVSVSMNVNVLISVVNRNFITSVGKILIFRNTVGLIVSSNVAVEGSRKQLQYALAEALNSCFGRL